MKISPVTVAHPDYQKRVHDALDRSFIFLTAAVVVWCLLTALFYTAWPGNDIPVPENEIRIKDMLNVLMYVIPLTFAGLSAGHLFVALLNSVVIQAVDITISGLSVLLRKIIRRGESHE